MGLGKHLVVAWRAGLCGTGSDATRRIAGRARAPPPSALTPSALGRATGRATGGVYPPAPPTVPCVSGCPAPPGARRLEV